MCTELRPLIEGNIFDAHELAVLDLASGCGAMLYRPGRCVGAYVAHLPQSPAGRQAVLCAGTKADALHAAEQLAAERGLRDIVLLTNEETPRFERCPNGLRLWCVPQRCLNEHGRRRQAGQVVPFLLDFTFGIRS